MIPAWRDLGLLRMNLQSLKDALTPQAKLGYVKLRKIFVRLYLI